MQIRDSNDSQAVNQAILVNDPPAVTLLRLQGVWKRFPGVMALSDVTLEVESGEVHALLGENGAGKSTLMAIASGSLAPDDGSIELSGEVWSRLTPGLA